LYSPKTAVPKWHSLPVFGNLLGELFAELLEINEVDETFLVTSAAQRAQRRARW
jgi:hypothetical protein